jgi:hypothetical protein
MLFMRRIYIPTYVYYEMGFHFNKNNPYKANKTSSMLFEKGIRFTNRISGIFFIKNPDKKSPFTTLQFKLYETPPGKLSILVNSTSEYLYEADSILENYNFDPLEYGNNYYSIRVREASDT